jgi:Flp pilus assembly protein TadG
LIRLHHLRSWINSRLVVACRDDRAAQLVEFAVALPLLVVFVVGIFDFSGAFTLKQKLTNIARDAARAAAADPATDLCQTCSTTLPASVSDAFQLVDGYLIANKINDCGMNIATYTSGPGAAWKFSVASTSSSPCGITLIINRGYYFPEGTAAQPATATCVPPTLAAAQIQVISTCVSIQYTYQWRFGQVASLLGNTATLPTSISGAAVAMNEN